jgi:hypothetical protein
MGNYQSHTSGASFEPELTFWRSFVLLPLPLQLLNAKVISLPMHRITAILTCLISQALLQAALDKKERDFTGWFLQYEFSSLPAGKHSTISYNANRSYRWQPPQQAVTGIPVDLKTTSKLSNSFKCQCQQSWLFFQWEECLAQVLGGELASHQFPIQDR